MAKWGITYRGSKSKIAEKLLAALPGGKRFVDLFGGGFAMSHAAIMNIQNLHRSLCTVSHFSACVIHPATSNMFGRSAQTGKTTFLAKMSMLNSRFYKN